MNRRVSLLLLVLSCLSAAARGEITWSGDVDPEDPTTWSDSIGGFIGITGIGELTVDAGSELLTGYSYIGDESGSVGKVTVEGAGSTWSNNSTLLIGRNGEATLTISDGGSVSSGNSRVGGSAGLVSLEGEGSLWKILGDLSVSSSIDATLVIAGGAVVDVLRDTRVATDLNAVGSIQFDGGTLKTGSLTAASADLIGTGTIYTQELIGDVDLVFDATHGMNQTFTLNQHAGQDITVHLDINGNRKLGIGYAGAGTMAISDGVEVRTNESFIGAKPGSTGYVTVSGVGTTWNIVPTLHVGQGGEGILAISSGGQVSSSQGSVGSGSGSNGIVMVDGVGSTWASEYVLFVGRYGEGALSITGGGHVSSSGGYIGYEAGSTGLATVDGDGSSWSNGGSLSIGSRGHGTLEIISGGVVTVSDTTWVQPNSLNSSGRIRFDGGTLNTGALFAGSAELTGTGIINTGGLVSDVDLVFDATHGLIQTLNLNQFDGQDITIHLSQNGEGLLGAGHSANGTLTIADGVKVKSQTGYLGVNAGSTGIATVDGEGSLWSISNFLYVGSKGNGSLRIVNGGTVDSASNTLVASEPGSSGEIHFDGGTLTTDSLFAASEDLTGTGTIYARGLVSDIDLVFDATHGPDQTFTINEHAGQDITVHLTGRSARYWGAGYSDKGKLTIADGVEIRSGRGVVGVKAGASGTVEVKGEGSTWRNSTLLTIGFDGAGEQIITDGGSVSNYLAYIGYREGSTGRVTVDGAGSSWSNGDRLYVGFGGQATLNITNGGLVNSEWGYIGNSNDSASRVIVDGEGSTWTTGSLEIGSGEGSLAISKGGLVVVRYWYGLSISGYRNPNFLDLSTGGMLALFGEADESINQFLGLVQGTDAIRYWSTDLADWAPITDATYGHDYTLEYLTEGDLAGYTLLTVGTVPVLEPSSLAMLLVVAGVAAMTRRRPSKNSY